MAGLMFVAFGASFLICLAATYLVRRVSLRLGFVDRPGGHKTHKASVALGGGIALTLAICGPVLLGTLAAWLHHRAYTSVPLPDILRPHMSGIASKLPSVLAIVAGAVVLHVVGLIDDCKPLGPWLKLIVQAAVALFICGPVGVRAIEVLPPAGSVIVTALWMVLVTNAFNFLDNMDGLSAGVAATAAAIFAIAAASTGQIFVPVMAWVMVGALAAFLCFNFAPASIFMGDAGSLVIGYWMAVITVLTTFYDPARNLTPLGVFVPVLVLAVPCYDVLSVVLHRLRQGESPFRGDRRHFSHRLVQNGLSQRGAVLTIYLATAATGLPAIVLPRVDWGLALLLVGQCACVVIMIAILEHVPRARPSKDRPGAA